jgi:hypothetical protein
MSNPLRWQRERQVALLSAMIAGAPAGTGTGYAAFRRNLYSVFSFTSWMTHYWIDALAWAVIGVCVGAALAYGRLLP